VTVAIGRANKERWKAPPTEEEMAEASASPALGLLYWLYEQRLVRQIRSGPMPRHVGIILDGNRRYGRRTGLHDTRRLYALGAEKLDGILAWCGELHIPAVTLWVFSTANLHRRSAEVTSVLGAVEAKLTSVTCDPRLHQGRVRVRAIGRLELLPESTRLAIRAAEKATAHYDALVLTIAVAYGGREEIVDAVRALLTEKAEQGVPHAEVAATITPTEITRHLYTAGLPDPDLIIRISGEIRLSGFLLWQSAYSEFYFSDVYWPAFRKIDFLRAIRAFQQRQRRLGL
jgi:short-chain Z-isoprenyl diphosphate synthase